MKIEYENSKNPILPLDIYIPDAEAHVMPDGQLYIYGSYDLAEYEYCSNLYRVVSTCDMKHWNIHPISMHCEKIKWKEDIDISIYPDFDKEPVTPMWQDILDAQKELKKEAESQKIQIEKQIKRMLFAPDATYHNGQYLLFFCMDDGSEGVAFSNSPEGPFADAIKLPCRGIDPAIFIDDDNKGYYYWGQFYSHAVELESDMISFKQEKVKNWVLTEAKHYFHEGMSMRKIGNIYYAVYADMERGKPTSLGYSTSNSPLGPFEYQGIIIDNDGCDPMSWNNHGSIECYREQWYIFYHRSTRKSKKNRRLCIEPITINEDGTIDEVLMTSQGPGKPFEPGESMMGYQVCQLLGDIYIDAHAKYGEALHHISDGDIGYFRYTENREYYKQIIFECEGDGIIEVLMNNNQAGTYEIINGVQKNNSFIVKPGKYEVKLRFVKPKEMTFIKCVMK